MSSSSDVVVPRGAEPGRVRELHHPELAGGNWTRFGAPTVRGDATTETFLDGLAAQTRDAARAQGFAVGWGEGLREGRARAAREAELEAAQVAARTRVEDERREQEHRQAVASLVQAAADLREAAGTLCERMAEQAGELAFAVTRELIGRELAVAMDPGGDVVRRVLAVLPKEGAVTVRIPQVLADDPTVAGLSGAGLVVLPDPTLGLGDAEVQTDEMVLDLRVDTAISRLKEVLS